MNKNLKKKLCYLCLSLLATAYIFAANNVFAANNKNGDKDGDPVVLKINDQEIKQSTVLQAVRILSAQNKQQQATTDKTTLYNLAINDIIGQALSYELAVNKKLDLDKNINQQINSLARTAAEDLAQYKRQMMIAAWRDQLPVPDKTTAEWQKDYKDFIKNNPGTTLYRPADIVVATDEEAINIISQLKNGASFATLAKRYSLNRTTAAKGGDIGFISAQQLPPNLALVVSSLKKNEFTNVPVKAAGGSHVIKLLDKKTGAPPAFNQSQEGLMALAKEKMARQKILERAKESTILLIDKNNQATPIIFQPPQATPANP
ncbi:MAG: peptidylprolyl isomerase [Hydrotalea sp.]|nr:peptidylprolyl isomerase [Hydrotalea sp.]